MVPDADLRGFRLTEKVCHSCEQFVEVDHDVRAGGLDVAVDERDATDECGKAHYVVDGAVCQIVSLVGRGGEEVRAFKAIEWGFEFSAEKFWQFACAAFSNQHLHDFMAFFSQVFFEGQGLCEVSASLSLYDE